MDLRQCSSREQQEVEWLHQMQLGGVVGPVPHNNAAVVHHKPSKRCRYRSQWSHLPEQLPLVLHRHHRYRHSPELCPLSFFLHCRENTSGARTLEEFIVHRTHSDMKSTLVWEHDSTRLNVAGKDLQRLFERSWILHAVGRRAPAWSISVGCVLRDVCQKKACTFQTSLIVRAACSARLADFKRAAFVPYKRSNTTTCTDSPSHLNAACLFYATSLDRTKIKGKCCT